LLVVSVFFFVPASFARAQIGPAPAALGYPMYGYGYGGMGYGYGYPAYGYGFGYPGPIGYGFGYPWGAYPTTGYGGGVAPGYGLGYYGIQQFTYGSAYSNPLYGQGLTPLGIQSALSENALIRGSAGAQRSPHRALPSNPVPGGAAIYPYRPR